MAHRRHVIEEIVTSFHALRNRVHSMVPSKETKGRMTRSQWFVLSIIGGCRGLGIKKIAEILGTSSSAATQLVDELVKDKLVIRTHSASDRRALRLVLSPRGHRHIALMKKVFIGNVSVLFDALSDGELDAYLRLQQKILNHNLKK